jgi:hypothetical protein
MVDVAKGQILALFAFDLGYGVSLERLQTLLQASAVQPLSSRKLTPPYIQYARPPRRISLGTTDIFRGREGAVHVTLFDFGAASLTYQWQLPSLELAGMPELAKQVYSLNLEADAKHRIERLSEAIASAIDRPGLSTLVEDFYIFVLEELNPPLTAEELLARQSPALAQLLRLDTAPLSRVQQEEALSSRISYYVNDLVLIDWNAAVIYDQDYEDTTNVLELLNIELLEARYIDAQLDNHIEGYSKIVHSRAFLPIPLRSPYKKAIREMAELRIDSSLLAERVENSLKLVGDLYLARVYSAATQRLHLREWDNIISRKLDIVANFYQLLTDRVGSAQSQTLELVVVVLILVELLISLLRLRG